MHLLFNLPKADYSELDDNVLWIICRLSDGSIVLTETELDFEMHSRQTSITLLTEQLKRSGKWPVGSELKLVSFSILEVVFDALVTEGNQ